MIVPQVLQKLRQLDDSHAAPLRNDVLAHQRRQQDGHEWEVRICVRFVSAGSGLAPFPSRTMRCAGAVTPEGFRD